MNGNNGRGYKYYVSEWNLNESKWNDELGCNSINLKELADHITNNTTDIGSTYCMYVCVVGKFQNEIFATVTFTFFAIHHNSLIWQLRFILFFSLFCCCFWFIVCFVLVDYISSWFTSFSIQKSSIQAQPPNGLPLFVSVMQKIAWIVSLYFWIYTILQTFFACSTRHQRSTCCLYWDLR